MHEQTIKRRRNQLFDEMVTGAKTKHAAGGKAEDKHKATYRRKRALARLVVRKSLKKWRSPQAEDLKVYSRRHLLEALIPETGKSLKSSSKSNNVKKIEGQRVRHDVIHSKICVGGGPWK